MKLKSILALCAVAAFTVTAVAPAIAAPVRPWANSSGSGTFFSWNGGGDDNGLFGDPSLIGGNTFLFFPNNFRAESQGAGLVSTDDRMEFNLIADPGFEITGIQISEIGDYELSGDASVDVIATLTLSELIAPNRVYSDSLTPNFDPLIQGSGTWSADGLIDLSTAVPGVTQLNFELYNLLEATASVGGVASIEKTLVGEGFQITIIPEPASLAMLGLGAFAVIRRRRA